MQFRRPTLQSKLSYSGNLLVENRNGLIVDAEVFHANGTAERNAALIMLEQLPGTKPVTLGGDKGFDTFGFVAECRNLGVTPEVPQNEKQRAAVGLMAAPRAISVRPQQKKEEADRRMLRLAEDNRVDA